MRTAGLGCEWSRMMEPIREGFGKVELRNRGRIVASRPDLYDESISEVRSTGNGDRRGCLSDQLELGNNEDDKM